MKIRFHPHAIERLEERGATEDEVLAAIRSGEKFPARYGRVGFRRNFAFNSIWLGKHYNTKQLEVYAVDEDGWLVITVFVKYF
jgi:hypothetical protein